MNDGAWSGVDRVGAWWGPMPDLTPDQPRRQFEGEVEVVAAAGKRVVVAGEAKWTREPIGFGVLNRLRRVARHIPGADTETELILLGRAFDARLAEAADRERVTLIAPDALYA